MILFDVTGISYSDRRTLKMEMHLTTMSIYVNVKIIRTHAHMGAIIINASEDFYINQHLLHKYELPTSIHKETI